MKILVVTTSFGEYADSHTVRLSNLFSQMQKKYSVTYCYPGSHKDLDGNLAIEPGFLLKLSSFLKRKTKYSYRLYANLTKNLLFPDRFSGFSKRLELYFKGDFDFDVIISASGSIESHIAAYNLAKKFDIELIMDYGDPIYSLVGDDIKSRIKAIEAEIIKYASKVIFTTKSTKEQYDSVFFCGPKSSVISYGYDKSKIELSGNLTNIPFEKVDYISHIGTAFSNDRNLIPLIEAIKLTQENNNTGFILAGRRSLAFSEMANKVNLKNFIDYDLVDYLLALEIQKKSKINVIVGNKDGRQVPGKIFALAAISERILYISQCSRDMDESLDILESHKNMMTCDNNTKSIFDALELLINSEVKSEGISEFANYESYLLGRQLEELINDCKESR